MAACAKILFCIPGLHDAMTLVLRCLNGSTLQTPCGKGGEPDLQ